MSVIKQGILGAGSGKVGGVIMSSWKGIATIRSMPSTVENPNTAAQQAQRSKFSKAVEVSRLLLAELIHPYWDPFTKGMSGYNSFIKTNINCFDSTGLIAPAAFKASRGVLVGVTPIQCEINLAETIISVNWDDNSGIGDALGTDLAVLVYYNQTKNYWKVYSSPKKRSDFELSYDDGVIASADTVHVWVFMRRPDNSRISDSVYILATPES